MREIRTSGLTSGELKRGHWLCLNATASFLDSATPIFLILLRVHDHISLSPATLYRCLPACELCEIPSVFEELARISCW